MPDEPKKYKLPWELPSEASKSSEFESPQLPIQGEQTTPTLPTDPTLTPQQVYPQQQPVFQPEKKKSRSKLIIVLSIFVVSLLIGAGIFGFLIFQGVKESSQVQQKVTSFLSHVSKNDLESAYKLTSKEFRQVTTLEDFEEDINLYKVQYSDFEKLNQTGFSIEAHSGQPTTYQYSGTITYTDGDSGDVEATLIKEEGEYKIQYVYVTR